MRAWSLGLLAVAASSGCITPRASPYAFAATNAVVGGVLYAVAGGCKISGCPTNTQCNVVTERCDPIQCGSDVHCEDGEVCDQPTGKCIPSSLGLVSPSSSAVSTPAVPSPPVGPNATTTTP